MSRTSCGKLVLACATLMLSSVGCAEWSAPGHRPGMDPTVQQTGSAQQAPPAPVKDKHMTVEQQMWQVNDSSTNMPTTMPAP